MGDVRLINTYVKPIAITKYGKPEIMNMDQANIQALAESPL